VSEVYKGFLIYKLMTTETWFTNGPNSTHTVKTNITITVLSYWQSCQNDDNHLKMEVETTPGTPYQIRINNARNCFPIMISLCVLNTNLNRLSQMWGKWSVVGWSLN